MRIYKYLQRIVYLFAALALPLVARAQIEDVRAAFDARHLIAYLVAAFLISVFVMLFYNRVYYFREKQVSQDTARINAQLAMILESSKTETWTYDVNKVMFTKFTEQGQKETIYRPYDFSQFYDRDDFQAMRKMLQDISNWEMRFGTMTVKSAPDKEADATSPSCCSAPNKTSLKIRRKQQTHAIWHLCTIRCSTPRSST